MSEKSKCYVCGKVLNPNHYLIIHIRNGDLKCVCSEKCADSKYPT